MAANYGGNYNLTPFISRGGSAAQTPLSIPRPNVPNGYQAGQQYGQIAGGQGGAYNQLGNWVQMQGGGPSGGTIGMQGQNLQGGYGPLQTMQQINQQFQQNGNMPPGISTQMHRIPSQTPIGQQPRYNLPWNVNQNAYHNAVQQMLPQGRGFTQRRQGGYY